LLAWTLVLFAIFQVINIPLITPPAPLGIVSHQFALTPEKAQSVIASWDTRARLFAMFGLGLDYLFMASYGLTVALGALLAAGRHRGRFSRLGTWVTYGVFVGILFDGLENFGQANQLLNGNMTVPGTALVGVFATLKFTLLAFGILYGLAGWFLPAE
jgi:hypothetical protein